MKLPVTPKQSRTGELSSPTKFKAKTPKGKTPSKINVDMIINAKQSAKKAKGKTPNKLESTPKGSNGKTPSKIEAVQSPKIVKKSKTPSKIEVVHSPKKNGSKTPPKNIKTRKVSKGKSPKSNEDRTQNITKPVISLTCKFTSDARSYEKFLKEFLINCAKRNPRTILLKFNSNQKEADASEVTNISINGDEIMAKTVDPLKRVSGIKGTFDNEKLSAQFGAESLSILKNHHNKYKLVCFDFKTAKDANAADKLSVLHNDVKLILRPFINRDYKDIFEPIDSKHSVTKKRKLDEDDEEDNDDDEEEEEDDEEEEEKDDDEEEEDDDEEEEE